MKKHIFECTNQGFHHHEKGRKFMRRMKTLYLLIPGQRFKGRLGKGFLTEILNQKYVFSPKTLLICTHSQDGNSEANFHSHISILSIPFSHCYRPGMFGVRQLARLFLATLLSEISSSSTNTNTIPTNLNRSKITFSFNSFHYVVHFFNLAKALCSLSLHSPVLARQKMYQDKNGGGDAKGVKFEHKYF